MKTNMGVPDRLIRVIAAIVIVVLFLTGKITGLPATLLLILAGIFVLTSIVSFCPLYLPFGFSTKKKKQA